MCIRDSGSSAETLVVMDGDEVLFYEGPGCYDVFIEYVNGQGLHYWRRHDMRRSGVLMMAEINSVEEWKEMT